MSSSLLSSKIVNKLKIIDNNNNNNNIIVPQFANDFQYGRTINWQRNVNFNNELDTYPMNTFIYRETFSYTFTTTNNTILVPVFVTLPPNYFSSGQNVKYPILITEDAQWEHAFSNSKNIKYTPMLNEFMHLVSDGDIKDKNGNNVFNNTEYQNGYIIVGICATEMENIARFNEKDDVHKNRHMFLEEVKQGEMSNLYDKVIDWVLDSFKKANKENIILQGQSGGALKIIGNINEKSNINKIILNSYYTYKVDQVICPCRSYNDDLIRKCSNKNISVYITGNFVSKLGNDDKNAIMSADENDEYDYWHKYGWSVSTTNINGDTLIIYDKTKLNQSHVHFDFQRLNGNSHWLMGEGISCARGIAYFNDIKLPNWLDNEISFMCLTYPDNPIVNILNSEIINNYRNLNIEIIPPKFTGVDFVKYKHAASEITKYRLIINNINTDNFLITTNNNKNKFINNQYTIEDDNDYIGYLSKNREMSETTNININLQLNINVTSIIIIPFVEHITFEEMYNQQKYYILNIT